MTTGKLIALVIGAYLLYYAGLFIYVLFFEKEKAPEITEEVDVLTFEDSVETKNVTIEEAENLNVTEFTNNPIPEANTSFDNEVRIQDLNALKLKFVQEQGLEQEEEKETIDSSEEDSKPDGVTNFSIKKTLHSAEEVANNMINGIKNNKLFAQYQDYLNFASVKTYKGNEKVAYS